MAGESRIPDTIEVEPPDLDRGFLFWADPSVSDWAEVRTELEAAFAGSQQAARSEESVIYVVRNDDLLGRGGPEPAMVAAGLLSAARTAALEGWRKGWTANVVAYDSDRDPAAVLARAVWVLKDGEVTGELVHIGPGHVGKALA